MKNFSRLLNILFYYLVRQDSPVDMSGVDISGFHPPWHSMQEFQLRKTKSLSHIGLLFYIEAEINVHFSHTFLITT